jgi:hypothetical protein
MQKNYRQLGCAVAIQAMKDYFRVCEANQKIILKELRSAWVDWLTDGLSLELANQLEANPEKVKKRYHLYEGRSYNG